VRSRDEVQCRIRGILVEELDRRLGEAGRRLPHVCRYNYRHPLDVRRTVRLDVLDDDPAPNPHYNKISDNAGQVMGLCTYGSEDPTEWNGDICEEPIDAQRCPMFVPIRSKDDVLQEFRRQLADPEWVAAHMPGLSELVWVLDTLPPNIPWWRRVLWWFQRVRHEPLSTTESVTALLPGGGSNEGS